MPEPRHRQRPIRRSNRKPSRAEGPPDRSSRGESSRASRPAVEVPDDDRLPKWVLHELARTTPPSKYAETIELVVAATEAFEEARYGEALEHAQAAKKLAPRDPTIRELMALSAYRLGHWSAALRELRTYRRYTGDAQHLAIEMDVLRAMDRPDDVEEVWRLVAKLEPQPDALAEAKVVYAGHLLDQGRPREAWDVVAPKRLSREPFEAEQRQWYVAALAADRLGDRETARRLCSALGDADPAFPGLRELERQLDR